jgi:putative transposase
MKTFFARTKTIIFFLNKAKLHLLPYMKIYAYCLMPNHFHLLISIRSEPVLKTLFASADSYQKLKEIGQHDYIYRKISKSLANLCSSYMQAVNKFYHRKGSLFMPNFKSNQVPRSGFL